MIIDTIKLLLTRYEVPDADFILIVNSLPGYKNIYKDNDENVLRITAYLENLRISASRFSLIVEHSLCRYLKGNNYSNMTISDIKQAIVKLSQSLKLPMELASIKSIDIAFDLNMSYSCSLYINNMNTAAGYRKSQTEKNGVYFKSDSKMLAIYDKIKERSDKKQSKPENIKNLLRFELRLKNKFIRKNWGTNLSVEMLYDETFLNKLVELWQKEFNKVRISNRVLALKSLPNIPEFRNLLVLQVINDKGEQYWFNEINRLLERSKNKTDSTAELKRLRKTTEKLRKYITELIRMKSENVNANLRDEVKQKIAKQKSPEIPLFHLF
jgi:hypothetical protein